MPQPNSGWTLEMVHALPDDGNRYELIDGELFVTPAPTVLHQSASLLLSALLNAFTRTRGLKTVCAPVAVRLPGGGEVQPDLLVFERPSHSPLPATLDIAQLVLAVEILSPSTERTDRHAKRHLYQQAGVAEYWIIDLAARVIERWRPNDVTPEVVSEVLAWSPREDGEVLRIDVRAYIDSAYD
ncbi:MAG: Uma2 family endonuclease [Gemmatimonadaceae bacterium]